MTKRKFTGKQSRRGKFLQAARDAAAAKKRRAEKLESGSDVHDINTYQFELDIHESDLLVPCKIEDHSETQNKIEDHLAVSFSEPKGTIGNHLKVFFSEVEGRVGDLWEVDFLEEDPKSSVNSEVVSRGGHQSSSEEMSPSIEFGMVGPKKRGRPARTKPSPSVPQLADQSQPQHSYRQYSGTSRTPQPSQISPREISASEFENFITDVKSEPCRMDDNGEKMTLLSKINLLRHEIQNMKEMKEIQSLRKRNNLLHIEVLKLRESKLSCEPTVCDAPEMRNEYGKPTNTPFEKTPAKDSINIRNVIYNNCGQSFVIKQKEDPPMISVKSNESLMANYHKDIPKPAPQTRDHHQYDVNDKANFTSVASTILNYLADKQDIFLETQKLQQLAYDMLKDDNNRFDDSFTPVVKTETPDPYIPPPKETRTVIPLPPPVPAPTEVMPPFPMPVVVKAELPEEGEILVTTEAEQHTEDDLHFSYTEIKPKIIEYLSDKVDKATVISAIRRLTKTKAKSMMRQPIEEHTKLLRVYLFQDKNILVQDIFKCLTEFAKDTYHSVRYYGVSLTKRTTIAPTKKTKGNSKTPSCSKDKQNDDYVILPPLNDRVNRPKFRVEMIEDLIISEDFQLVSSKPFEIRPLITEVVITSPHLKLLEPIVLRALADKTLSLTSMPIISISPKLHRDGEFNDFPKANKQTNEFVLINPTPGSEQYGLEQLTSNKDIIDLTESEKAKKRPIEASPLNREAKIPKTQDEAERTNRDFSIVNVEDIFKKAMKDDVPTFSVMKYEIPLATNTSTPAKSSTKSPSLHLSPLDIEECKLPKKETKFELDFSINLDESDEDDSIIIN